MLSPWIRRSGRDSPSRRRLRPSQNPYGRQAALSSRLLEIAFNRGWGPSPSTLQASTPRCRMTLKTVEIAGEAATRVINTQPDFEELLRLLKKHGVDYMIVYVSALERRLRDMARCRPAGAGAGEPGVAAPCRPYGNPQSGWMGKPNVKGLVRGICCPNPSSEL